MISRSPADDAETIAIAALSYFATEPETLNRFFALTGLDASSLRDASATPAFVAGVLDFVLQDEGVLIAVADAQDVSPEAIVAARVRLERGRTVEDDWPPRAADDWA